MKCDVIAARASSRREGARPQGAPRGAPRGHERRGPQDPRESGPRDHAGVDDGRRRAEDRRARQEGTGENHERSSSTRTPARGPGHHRQVRLVPREADASPTARRSSRRHAGRGGQKFERGSVPVFDTVEDAVKRPAPTVSSSSCRRPARPTRSSRPIDAGVPSSSASPRASRCSTWCASAVLERGSPRRASSARTARASSRRASARSASCPGTSTSPAASASCRARAR
jgi:hypothetical protein